MPGVISIHALREEGDRKTLPNGGFQYISIHALREEGDRIPGRGHAGPRISIHALREEGDSSAASPRASPAYFYPRPPRGGRHWSAATKEVLVQFLSTPSARRATPQAGRWRPQKPISIHALREEGDLASLPLLQIQTYFYPRPPRGGRRALVVVGELEGGISIHALREEGDPLPELRQ